ncbi:MAG: LacI family transcriptional regulator [Phycisphaerae bacterium]|nr:LacI family transcriptional regulator [Phycisphaerae bacterium]
MAGPSIAEIARRLKLSKTTVSRVFNDVPNSGIAPATRRRVLAAIREMGYEPNLSARALARGRTHVIGAMMIDVNNPFASGYVSAVEELAGGKGYGVLLCNTRGSGEKEREQCRMLRQRGVEGLLIEHVGPAETLRELVDEGFPFVLLDRCPQSPQFDYVTFDDVEGGRLATMALIDAGRTKVAHIAGPQAVLPAEDRLIGYREALDEAELPWRDDYVVWVDRHENPDDGEHAADRLLDLPSPPDAVFCYSDHLALGVFRAAARRGVRVPHDLAVIGCDDLPFCPWTAVSLASVRLNTRQLGHESAGLLLEKIERDDARGPGSRRILIKPEVVHRESLGQRR